MTRTVLFVCVGNSGRSQMAEAIFNKLKPDGFRAISAGTKPAKEVNPLVVQVLREIGIDASGARPKPISTKMIAEAEKVITMGCEASNFCPARFLSRVEDWNIGDPKGKTLDEIRSIRDTIHDHVRELLRQMQSTRTLIHEGLSTSDRIFSPTSMSVTLLASHLDGPENSRLRPSKLFINGAILQNLS